MPASFVLRVEADMIQTTNKWNRAILERMAGLPCSPATPESDNDPRNPNVKMSCDAERLAKDSIAELDRTPHRGAPALRLVWYATSRL